MNRRKVLSWLTLSWVSGMLSIVIGACSRQVSNQNVASPKIGASQNGFFKVGNVQDLEETGRLLQTIDGGKKVLVVGNAQDSDTLHALNPTCTHQGCPVDFEQDAQNIFCACHGSTYKLDGTVVKGPASSPLETYTVKVDGDSILVNPNSA